MHPDGEGFDLDSVVMTGFRRFIHAAHKAQPSKRVSEEVSGRRRQGLLAAGISLGMRLRLDDRGKLGHRDRFAFPQIDDAD